MGWEIGPYRVLAKRGEGGMGEVYQTIDTARSTGGVLTGHDEQFRVTCEVRVPLGRKARPDVLNGPLVFLASRASSYVTGLELRADGGFTAW